MSVTKQWHSIVALAACLSFTAHLSAQTQPAFPELSGPFEIGRLEIDVTDAG